MIIAALAEAMQVRAANEPSDRLGDVVATYRQALSAFGQVIAAAVPGRAASRRRSCSRRRCCARAARYVGSAADLAVNGNSRLPEGIPEARGELAATFRRDADRLIAVIPAD